MNIENRTPVYISNSNDEYERLEIGYYYEGYIVIPQSNISKKVSYCCCDFFILVPNKYSNEYLGGETYMRKYLYER